MHTKPHRHDPLHIATQWIAEARNTTLLGIWLGATVGFAALYAILGDIAPAHAPTIDPSLPFWNRFWDSLYYSIITATSTGYGDIVPQGFSKVLASIQAILSLSTFAALVTKLVAHKQELALEEMHRLAFEERHHNICEELFITRKDFDIARAALEEKGTLPKDTLRIVAIAFERFQSLIEEIPGFYHRDDHLYSIDSKREQLLLEAMERTVERIRSLLETCKSSHCSLSGDAKRELQKLTDALTTLIPVWRENIAPASRHHLERLQGRVEELCREG